MLLHLHKPPPRLGSRVAATCSKTRWTPGTGPGLHFRHANPPPVRPCGDTQPAGRRHRLRPVATRAPVRGATRCRETTPGPVARADAVVSRSGRSQGAADRGTVWAVPGLQAGDEPVAPRRALVRAGRALEEGRRRRQTG